jgi:hypothetical protein
MHVVRAKTININGKKDLRVFSRDVHGRDSYSAASQLELIRGPVMPVQHFEMCNYCQIFINQNPTSAVDY